ncbi:uncharacterized protein N7484_008031 [Penicillium longicatenatum]|uniref:uncharacterized protein n=1 Tax=Penicillium longicatenatum TaxID=1561947 RepID=UPI002548148E|nr:uncharacterized protein N7484_008031 [Penicillium longicatenatum]KAJ5640169.1 hypothetical protein N7484_008031 [Penicillium longicatenatum]
MTVTLARLTKLGKSVLIQKLDSTEAIQLLLNNSGLSEDSTYKNPKGSLDTLALANRLSGLPLAIIIATAFMRQTGTTIAQRQYQQGNMLETWMISYREIQSRSPNAAELLLLLTYFDNRDIYPNVPGWLQGIILSGLTFKLYVKHLIDFSLLKIKQQEGSYAMHPMVQDWCFHIASTKKNVTPSQLCELALISVG